MNEKHTTALSFAHYYNGSELVVSGKLKEGVSSRMMSMNIRGYDGQKNVTYSPASRTLLELTIPSNELLIEDLTERLWAYMKIKQLLVQLLVSTDAHEQERLKSEALRLSLKYNFVTPLTSFVVVQSDEYLVATDAKLGRAYSAGHEVPVLRLSFLLISLFYFVFVE